jgi:hypothetical protein
VIPVSSKLAVKTAMRAGEWLGFKVSPHLSKAAALKYMIQRVKENRALSKWP